MKVQNIFLLAFLAVLLSTCSTTYRISSDYVRGTAFSSFETFQILKHKDGFPNGANPINKQRIDKAIVNEMTALGYKTSAKPDLLVSWFVKVKNVREVDVYRDYYGRWGYFRHAEIHEYQEGTLVIDLIDRVKKEVVWHGKTSGRVWEDMPKVEEKINEAVHAMFNKYAKDAKLDKRYAMN